MLLHSGARIIQNTGTMTNTLFYGDNLAVLREHVPSLKASISFISTRHLRAIRITTCCSGSATARSRHAQIKAFEDTWTWDTEAARTYQETVEGGGEVAQVLRAFRTFLHESDMLAYLGDDGPALGRIEARAEAYGFDLPAL